MMDCGPASLQAALRGLGIEIPYDVLREHCGTTVDGTELAALDEVALSLGLEAEQELIIAEHLPYQQTKSNAELIETLKSLIFGHTLPF